MTAAAEVLGAPVEMHVLEGGDNELIYAGRARVLSICLVTFGGEGRIFDNAETAGGDFIQLRDGGYGYNQGIADFGRAGVRFENGIWGSLLGGPADRFVVAYRRDP